MTEAKISVNAPGVIFVEKGGGFYVTSGIFYGTETVKIDKSGYKTAYADINNSDETVILTPDGILEKYIVIKCRIAGAKNKNIDVKYGILNRTAVNMASGIDQEEPDLVKMEFSEKNALVGRTVAFEGTKEVYGVTEYDFVKKGYRLKSGYSKPPEEGSFACVLNDAKTDGAGEFNAFIPKSCFDKQRVISILVAERGKQHIKSVKTADKELCHKTLVFGGKTEGK